MQLCLCVGAQSFSCVWLFVTPWTVAHQAPLSMGFSRHIYWSGLPFPSPGYLLNLGIKPASLASPALTGRFFTTSATWEAHDATGEKQITSLTDLTVNPKGWCCQSAALNMPANLENSIAAAGLESECQFSFQSQRKAMPKNAQATTQLYCLTR